MTHRIDLPSPPGTLFKRPREIRKHVRAAEKISERSTRDHLDATRQCPCVVCHTDVAIDAAHVRFGSLAGMGRKPPDSEVLPLCRAHHMEQHSVGELSFWAAVGIAPRELAAKLWELSPNVEAMRAMCFVAKVIGGGKCPD